jgi:DNA mismatch repair ATPase MutS
MTIFILVIVLLYSLQVVRREICAMVTKGTLTEGESLLSNPDPSYILSVTEDSQYSSKKSQDGHTIGVCIIDVSTSKFIVGQVGGFMILTFIFRCTYV